MTPHEQAVLQDYTRNIPVSVAGIARALGLSVKAASLRPTISGQIQPDDQSEAGFTIRVNRHEPIERQRFTLAHEISHYLLHRDRIGRGVFDTILYRSNLHSRQEAEANRLAASIIMPLNHVRDEFERLGGVRDDETVAELASIFKVSKPAMLVRLEAL